MAKKKGKKDKKKKGQKMSRKEFEKLLRPLQVELVKMQEWVKASGAKICIVFEGRDTAGKGGTIHRIVRRGRNRRCTFNATCPICRLLARW
jgi:polyphosphate kinase 2 (PPK2 family)